MAMQSVTKQGGSPTVSVVLSVKNGGRDLPLALGTILNQSFTNFELIAINNGSTDQTRAYLDSIADPRVRVFHQADAGLAGALNRGISLARGRYIARQDHDDLADPSRIAKQVQFLDTHPDHALVGTRAEIWVGDTPSGRFHDHPTDDRLLRFDLLFNNPFVHSSVMIRKAALDRVGAYTTDPARQPPEDYELWSRISRHYRVTNLAERLTIYREVPSSMSRVSARPFLEKLVTISSENLAHATGATAPQQVHVDIAALFHGVEGRVSAEPNLADMCAVLAEAGRRIGDDQAGPELAKRVANAQLQIRHRVMLKRQPALGLAWRAARAVRGKLRRLIPAAREGS
ncbi:glycosyltransferase family 2 protein [Bradyrhizobium sacchari]|uniref:Glycosyltransferase involved in cell wall biosynthesis n=1 Tax=Bradyrhizobium sacchari TaxID=1399419 RepID=A0A560JPF4_9BRAD|nr:glycosyltransferase [Bradyrhizobium sacchari]TWB59191.1 glycosyltransferase involved in cell wall biosynthesis [Bradyrhizobium sacchari]TWB72449.1 glycosyltransferase involved in cell wall biosynthesis [Bradyrhizobium sacchari]